MKGKRVGVSSSDQTRGRGSGGDEKGQEQVADWERGRSRAIEAKRRQETGMSREGQ